MLVVDASVAVKWFIEEPLSAQASSVLRSGQRLIAPELIRIEVAAAIGKFLRTKTITERQARLLLDKWNGYLAHELVGLEPTGNDFTAAVDYSVSLRHQLQDCLYLAVAQRLNTPLVTTDEKLLKKASEIGCALHPLEV